LESITGCNEQPCLCRSRGQLPAIDGGRFKNPHRSSSHSYDAPGRLLNLTGCILRDRVPLSMHLVSLYLSRPHRTEGIYAYVERNPHEPSAEQFETRHHVSCEVQSGTWCCRRATILRIDRLV